jgi:hypothetical protein
MEATPAGGVVFRLTIPCALEGPRLGNVREIASPEAGKLLQIRAESIASLS